eukprot:8301975-Heterocapsa_arctica.AAC.1
MNHGEEARPVPGPDSRRPESPKPRDQGPSQTTPKRKWIPQEVLPEYEGPRLTGGQELRRLFAAPAQVCPLLTQEDLPRLPQAKGDQGNPEGERGAQRPRDFGART